MTGETIKDCINEIELPQNERIDSYFYVNRRLGKLEYNSLMMPLQNDGSTNIDFLKLFLEAHIDSYLKISDCSGNYTFHRIQNEYNHIPCSELSAGDIDSDTFVDASASELIHLIATRYINHTALLFVDVTKVSQLYAGQTFVTFNLIQQLDEFFYDENLTRVYKHYNNFYFLNYGTA